MKDLIALTVKYTIYYQRIMLVASHRSAQVLPNPWNSPPKVIPVFQHSPNDSGKKSSRSTFASERSKSTKKILVPRSPQLEQFFCSPRHRSAQRLLLSSQTHSATGVTHTL